MTKPYPRPFLPRSVIGRVLLFILSAGAVAVSARVLFLLAFLPVTRIDSRLLLLLAITVFFSALYVVGVVGLIWAVARPPWLKKFARRAANWFVVTLLIPAFLLLFGWLWLH